jgi:hypothetical protein
VADPGSRSPTGEDDGPSGRAGGAGAGVPAGLGEAVTAGEGVAGAGPTSRTIPPTVIRRPPATNIEAMARAGSVRRRRVPR